MVQKKKNNKISKFPKVKKELKDFMSDDQGKMTRKDVAKLGVSLAVLGMMMQSTAQGWDVSHPNPAHTNNIDTTTKPGCATHTNVTTQVDSHSNHSDGSWGC